MIRRLETVSYTHLDAYKRQSLQYVGLKTLSLQELAALNFELIQTFTPIALIVCVCLTIPHH